MPTPKRARPATRRSAPVRRRDDSEVTFSSLVATWRKRRGYSAHALSIAAEIGESLVGQIERTPGYDPRLSTIVKLATALRVPVVELIPRLRGSERRTGR